MEFLLLLLFKSGKSGFDRLTTHCQFNLSRDQTDSLSMMSEFKVENSLWRSNICSLQLTPH